MANRLIGKAKEKRAKLILGWLAQGLTQVEIQRRCKAKYGFGIHVDTIKAIESEGELDDEVEAEPVDEVAEKALVIASDSGLVPAREISPRLRAMITKVADLMIDDGVLTITIDGREVCLSYAPEERVFEV